MRFSFLAKNVIGLDISDRSIEAVEVSASQIIHKARTVLPAGIVERGRIKNQEKLLEAVRAVFEDAKIKNTSNKKLIFGLPESQTFIHIFDTGEKKENIEMSVKNELSGVVPVESKDMAYGFTVQKQEINGHLRVVAMAAERAVITEWKNFFETLKFSRVSIVAETFASYVGLGMKNESLPAAVIDIGANTTMVSVYDAQGACFASSLERGGDLATKIVSEAAGLPNNDEAEQEKCKNGLGSSNEKVKVALRGFLDDVIAGVKDFLRHVHGQRAVDVSNLILIGGTSQMPGLLDYFKTQTGLNVSVGSSSYLTDSGDLLYVEAAGLALYEKNQWQFPIFDHGLTEEKSRAQKTIKAKMLVEDVVENNGESAKIKKQKIILSIIAICGIIAIGLAFWYRSVQDNKHQAELAAKTQQFSFAHTLLLSVPVAVDSSEQTEDRVAGRIIENTIQIFGEKEEAIQTSRVAVTKQILDGETLWKEPLSASSAASKASANSNKAAANYTVRWLVYNDTNANSLFTEAATTEMRKTDVAYSVSNIEKKSLEPTENKNIYLLRGEVLVATDRQVEMLP